MALIRQVPGCSQRLSSGYDGYLDKRVGPPEQPADRSMAAFVEGHHSFLMGGEDFGAFLQTTNNAVHSIQEVLFVYLLLILTGSNQGSLIAYIGDISTRETRGLFGEELTVDIAFRLFVGVELQVAHMHIEDGLALFEVWQFHMDLTVETSGTHKGLVQHVGAVGGGQHNDIGAATETVHFGK